MSTTRSKKEFLQRFFFCFEAFKFFTTTTPTTLKRSCKELFFFFFFFTYHMLKYKPFIAERAEILNFRRRKKISFFLSWKTFPRERFTEMYGINRVFYIYLCDEARNQQLFVAFVPPSSRIILAIYNTIYGLCYNFNN